MRIDRLALGTFVRPGSERPDGAPRVETVRAHAVHHPDGVVLLDTGREVRFAHDQSVWRP